MENKKQLYICPMDLFDGLVKKGDLFQYDYSFKTYLPFCVSYSFDRKTHGLPPEIVETWEIVENNFKVKLINPDLIVGKTILKSKKGNGVFLLTAISGDFYYIANDNFDLDYLLKYYDIENN